MVESNNGEERLPLGQTVSKRNQFGLERKLQRRSEQKHLFSNSVNKLPKIKCRL